MTLPLNVDHWYIIVAAIVVVIMGPARLSRVITYDSFPPAAWLRNKWVGWTAGTGYDKLLTCIWCFTPWIVGVAMLWFWAGLYVPWIMVAWWVLWGWLALSYIASIVIARDEPGD